MPELKTLAGGERVPVATEEELLEFANKLRKAGNASLLGALLPSKPRTAMQCLIARNLNFDSEVLPLGYNFADGSDVWGMAPAIDVPWQLEEGQSLAQYHEARDKRVEELNVKVRELAHVAGCNTVYEGNRLFIKLPKHIGNAAAAFDDGVAFANYNTEKDIL